jgi:leucyl aminopeptidase
MFQSVRLQAALSPSVHVVFIFNDKKLDSAGRQLDAGGAVSAALERGECTGESGKIAEAFVGGASSGAGGKSAKGKASAKSNAARVIIVGLGKRESFESGALRNIAGTIARRLAATKDERVAIHLGAAISGLKSVDAHHAGRCLGEGLGLMAFHLQPFKGSAWGTSSAKKTSLGFMVDDEAVRDGARFGLGLAESTNVCRLLSETPPNIATPEFIAEEAQRMARKIGLKCSVMDEEQLERERMTGLINVGKASENKPRLIRLEWQGTGAGRGKKPLVLVGKTMTYDTGGLSLKVNNGMVGMKRDKDGGCAVLGAMHAIATIVQPSRPVVALLAAAENSLSDEAYRPDDVLTYRNGVTVEVTNTDAEGRLVLADALIWACEKEKPRAIVDLATLTGGVVTALGSTYAGLFCEDPGLRDKLSQAMEHSGERWWRLPMHDEYRDMMKSPIADIVNSNPNRKAHPIQGAAFLSFFVEKSVPWAHLDIAGVHVADSDAGCFIKGSTGWGVRLLADLVAE